MHRVWPKQTSWEPSCHARSLHRDVDACSLKYHVLESQWHRSGFAPNFRIGQCDKTGRCTRLYDFRSILVPLHLVSMPAQ